jgi:GT2 family glycosyltransferase/glycosyltransferase involved in cell wall biosynthesis
VNASTLPAGAPDDDAAEWHRIAEERRLQLERLQQQRLYMLAAGLVARIRRARWALRRLLDPPRATSVRWARSLLAVPRRLSAARREAGLRGDIARLPRPLPDHAGPRPQDITAVIVTAAQPDRLDALLAALGRVGVAALVVDNAGVPATAAVIARHEHATGLRLSTPHTYAAANAAAIAHVVTPWLLLLNDDVAPLEDTWIDRLCAAAVGPTVAVGAQLVHGRRGWLGGEALDLTVQHAGIGFELVGPLARPVHLERGSEPQPRIVTRTVLAATAACLLVDADAYRSVGGLHQAFDYGMEDVDLCLRLATRGRIVVALDAVLLHEEGATRLRGDRRTRAARQQANRRLLDARHGPQLRRRLALEALEPPTTDDGGSADPTITVLTVGVLGPTPAPLEDLVASNPALRLRQQGDEWSALLVVTDPTLLGSGRPPSAVCVGWFDDGVHASALAVDTWDALDRLDAVVVADAALAASIADRHPTLPVRVDVPPDAAGAQALLRRLIVTEHWSVRIGTPSGRAGGRWGDAPVAEALRRELRALGRVARVAGRTDWGGAVDAAADMTLHLKGRGVAPVAASQTNLVWIISHPSELAPGELDAADVVLAASDLLAEHLTARTSTPVHAMHQAADARTLTPGPHDPTTESEVLFVGNTRSVPRPAVLGALEAGLDLTLIGSGWERYVDPRLVLRSSIPNTELSRWYRSAGVVLNDHWDEMRRWGLVSNRVFDVLASGGCVVSDELPGLDELLGGSVPTFTTPEELAATVTRLLSDRAHRDALVARGQRIVLADHTWQHRAEQLVALSATLDRAGVTGTP